MSLVFVKLGGSLITDKTRPYTPRVEVIERLARELAGSLRQKRLRVLVGHGSGSFAHTSAAKYGITEGMRGKRGLQGFARVHHDAARLNHIVTHALLDAGVPAVPVPPCASAVAHARSLAAWPHEPLLRFLNAGLVPVVYGDVVLDLSQGAAVLSTEALFAYLAPRLHPARVLVLGETDGVLDSRGRTVPEITRANHAKLLPLLGGARGTDVTGGMRTKVAALLAIADVAPCAIINGLREGALEKALLGKPVGGTRVRA
ncbi:MAG: isopentenyl phosphate kinase [Candidatus Micrarchaeia archaeon]